MLQLKYAHELTWNDLKYLETPRDALRTIERVHGSKFTNESIWNAHRHSLPKFNTHKVHNGYNTIKNQLENGNVFLINHSTLSPIIQTLELKECGEEVEWTLRNYVNDMMRNTLRTVIDQVEKPKSMGVLRHAPLSANQQNTSNQKNAINKEKHQIKIQYSMVNGAENPSTYEVKLTVLDANNNRIHMRQVMDVLKNDTTKEFSVEKGTQFKIYPVREHMVDVREDFSKNKNFAQSEANDRIKPLAIETSEQIQGDITLHTVTIKIPPILRMGCFFDGTGNDPSDPKKQSNVYRLFDLYDNKVKKLPKSYKAAYIRGVGSEGDNWFEEGFGKIGGFGASARIAGMLYELELACSVFKKKFKTYPEKIYLDVFGFSRGATTARHYLNVLKQGFYGFNDDSFQKYITPKNIMFSFVGIFDSVGSYGIAGNDDDPGFNFNINPRWITDNGKVIHLIALNEYRASFDLQTIFSHQNRSYSKDIDTGKCAEIGLMGAHSDVGGGYAPNEQGVVNGTANPSQLSLMALQKMHNLAIQYGVPLDPLQPMNIESGLVDNYKIVDDAIQKPAARRLWMEWVEYIKYKEILEHKLHEMRTEDKPMSGRPPSIMVLQQTKKKIEIASKSIKELESRLAPEISNVSFDVFKKAFMHLDEYYIHESHAPFNETLGMWAEEEGSMFTVERLTRTVFFDEAQEFKRENNEWDRIARVAPAWMLLAEIQEFEFIEAKEFK